MKMPILNVVGRCKTIASHFEKYQYYYRHRLIIVKQDPTMTEISNIQYSSAGSEIGYYIFTTLYTSPAGR